MTFTNAVIAFPTTKPRAETWLRRRHPGLLVRAIPDPRALAADLSALGLSLDQFRELRSDASLARGIATILRTVAVVVAVRLLAHFGVHLLPLTATLLVAVLVVASVSHRLLGSLLLLRLARAYEISLEEALDAAALAILLPPPTEDEISPPASGEGAA